MERTGTLPTPRWTYHAPARLVDRVRTYVAVPAHRRNIIILVLVLCIAAFFTATNMFDFPHYESDEGTYMGSAWAMVEQGRLSYYTYNYDHPPFGWMQIGLWSMLTGGFTRFGMSINSGRVLMLLVTLSSTLLVYLIVRRVTGHTVAAALGALVFAVSPLAVSLHRQVWLDNLATLWLLISIYVLVISDRHMGRILLSAVTFGLAVWTKEVFIAFLPAMLYLAVVYAHETQRRFAGVLWAAGSVAMTSLFVLLAVLKDEFLPPGVLWSSPEPHVSMIETYLHQASREGGGWLLDPNSEFRMFLQQWIADGPLLVLGGLCATAAGLLGVRRARLTFGISLLILTFTLFLGRGGVVLFYYVIPLLALFAVQIGLITGHLLNLAERWQVSRHLAPVVAVLLTLVIGVQAAQANAANFTADSTASQKRAASWMADNLSSDSVIIMDSYPWVDLREPSFTGGETFENAHYIWPAVEDPSVRGNVLHENWRNIDYIVLSPNTATDVERGEFPLVKQALEHADLAKIFHSGNWTVQILRVRKLQEQPAPDKPILRKTWSSYKDNFIEQGRVADPQRNGQTTSEGQSYAMLRAVYMDDRETFDTVWNWTQQNLARQDDALYSWLWGRRDDGSQGVLDASSATDADQDIALALLFASRRWNEPAYEQAALRILDDIWAHETASVAGQRVVVAGNWAGGDTPVVNPSYFAPYAYRIFAEADPAHDWEQLVDSSYSLLEQIQTAPEWGAGSGLVPNWVRLDAETGELLPFSDQEQHSRFSYDASRVPWRITLDWVWFQDNRAKETVQRFQVLRDTLAQSGRLAASYNLDGTPAAEYEAASMYAHVAPSLLLNGDPELAHTVYTERILRLYQDDAKGVYWGDPTSYYDQNWHWFTTALFSGSLSNLWAGENAIEWDEVPLQE